MRGCVHTDAKLSNFIDLYPLSVDETTKISSTAVRVIDMDAGVFRHVNRIARPEATQEGWRPVWLHNVLFVSCFLKAQLPDRAFMEYWWRPMAAAVAHTMGLLAREDAALRQDTDFELARRFVYASKWAHGFHLGRQLPASPTGSDPQSVGRTAVLMAVYYFHDVWERTARDRYGAHVKAYRAASRATAEAEPGRPRAARSGAKGRVRAMEGGAHWFDGVYRVQGPAQFRYFEERMEQNDDPQRAHAGRRHARLRLHANGRARGALRRRPPTCGHQQVLHRSDVDANVALGRSRRPRRLGQSAADADNLRVSGMSRRACALQII